MWKLSQQNFRPAPLQLHRGGAPHTEEYFLFRTPRAPLSCCSHTLLESLLCLIAICKLHILFSCISASVFPSSVLASDQYRYFWAVSNYNKSIIKPFDLSLMFLLSNSTVEALVLVKSLRTIKSKILLGSIISSWIRFLLICDLLSCTFTGTSLAKVWHKPLY